MFSAAGRKGKKEEKDDAKEATIKGKSVRGVS
jgi:hypothetical protein